MDANLRQALARAAAATTRGTAQHERMPPALAPGWFEPDERRAEDWVALLAAHAERLHLVGRDNAPSGRWSALFDHDEALLLARIASERFDTAALASRAGTDTTSASGLAGELRRLDAVLQGWAGQLQRCEGAGAQTVAALLQALRAQRLGQEQRWLAPLEGAALLRADAATLERLRGALALHRAALARVREVAREQLARSLESGTHDAAAALVLTAAALTTSVQRQVNRFTDRLMDFYFHEVLHLVQRPAQPDRVHLLARREPGAPLDPWVPAGTDFVAGKDEAGHEIVFRTLESRRVDATQVMALRTLRLVRDPMISPEHELGYVSRARVQQLPAAATDADADAGPAAEARPGTSASRPVWPLFGGRELPSPGPAQDATFGLAVASPVLLLEEGERELHVRLRLGHVATADAQLREAVAQHAQRLGAADVTQAADAAAATAAAREAETLLTEIFSAYGRLERRRPAQGLPTARALARLAALRLAALPPAQRDPLHYYRQFLLLRAVHAEGAGFRFAAGRLFVHWLLAPADGGTGADPGLAAAAITANTAGYASASGVTPPADWLLDARADRAALHAAARRSLLGAPPAGGGRGDGGATGTGDRVAPDAPFGALQAAEDDAGFVGDPLSLFLLDPDERAAGGAAPRRPDRALMFAQLLGGLFSANVSTPGGWHEIAETHLVRPARQPAQGVDLELVLRLAPGDPPLVGCNAAVHGAEWETALPLLRLRLRGSGGLYPYSMLESAQLLQVALEVSVRGLRQVALHNQIGPLDAGKPFQPFGPLPAVGSYLVLAARELSCKPLQRLALQLRWGGLPADAAGFSGHYAQWPQDPGPASPGGAFRAPPDNSVFRAVPQVLRDGRWMHAGAAGVPLFASAEDGLALAERASVVFDTELLRQHHQPLEGGVPDAAPAFDIGARRGLMRLQLSQPAAAFGHADYAAVLTESVQANTRRRRLTAAAPLPRAPYTPLLEGLTVDYTAATRIELGSALPSAGSGQERVYHWHPFGVECVHPRPLAGVCRLLPQVLHDGTLFIGLSAPAAPARLSLLFHLHDASAMPGATPLPAPVWHALVGDRWQRLRPAQVLSDGTGGLLTSGIVVLELPEQMDTTHRVMPTGMYWLALGADGGFARFAGLHGVHAQALLAERVPVAAGTAPPRAPPSMQAPAAPPPPSRTPPQPLRPGTPMLPSRPVPGLAGALAVGPSTGLRAAETPLQLRVRAGERLHHRARAALPWDYERLLLEDFPDLGQVKCLPASALPPGTAAPGTVWVVVVPAAHRFDRASGVLAPRMNAAELAEMQRRLQRLAPPGAQVRVRNAAYERVQVRCTVRVADGLPEGAVLRRCEQAVFDALCPWLPGALAARFGWALRGEEIETRLRAVPGVAFVTGLSLLLLSRDDTGRHTLADTARRGAGPSLPTAPQARAAAEPTPGPGQAPAHTELHPTVPWSIAVPMERHLVQATRAATGRRAVATGIADLGVGSNLVVGPRHG